MNAPDQFDLEVIDRATAAVKALHPPIRDLMFPVEPWTDQETGKAYWIVADGGLLREPPGSAKRVTVTTESGVEVEVLLFPVGEFEAER